MLPVRLLLEKIQLKLPGWMSSQRNQDIEERLELVEYWMNQLVMLQTGPTRSMRSKEKEKLLDTMLSIMAEDISEKV